MNFTDSEALRDFLKEHTGLRAVFVEQYEGTVQPPYVVVGEMRTQTLPADNAVHYKEKRFYIDVFVKKTDNETSELVEEVLSDNDIYFENDNFWLHDLRLKCHEYEI